MIGSVTRREGDLTRLARRVYEERVAAGEIRVPRPVKASKATRAACALYRREKAKRVRRVDRLIAEAKAELARQDAQRLPRRGGRPRKVANGR